MNTLPQKSTLLIIDAQRNMFDENMPIHNATPLLTNLEKLRNQAQAAGIPIIWVRHDGGQGAVDELGTEGWQIHPLLAPNPTDNFVDKRQPDAFAGTQLHQLLQAQQITHLIIAGMQTNYCINATTQQAAALGYTITLVADAHSTFDNEEKTAVQLITEYNTALANIAELKNSDAIQF